MSRKKHFNQGHSPDSSLCVGCGEGIDISKKAHSISDDQGTHHYDLEGAHVASELREPADENYGSGAHCPSCTDIATDPGGSASKEHYQAKHEEHAEATHERG